VFCVLKNLGMVWHVFNHVKLHAISAPLSQYAKLLFEGPKFLASFPIVPLYIRDYPAIRKLSKEVYQGARVASMIKRRRFEARLMINYNLFIRLKDTFDSTKLCSIISKHPHIYDKLNRKYLHSKSVRNQRYNILSSTYKFIENKFSYELIESIYGDSTFIIGRIPMAKDDLKIFVGLNYVSKFEREGELTLGLYDENGERYYSLSFSISVSGGKSEAIIGCVQGSTPLPVIKAITKSIEGVRPQTLLVYLLRVFCQHYKIDRLLAVSSNAQVYFNTNKKHQIRFDYNKHWSDLGGRKVDDCFYEIPLLNLKKGEDQIPSKKRASYLRRYSLLDNLYHEVATVLRAYETKPEKGRVQRAGSALPPAQPLSYCAADI